jgi:hypothetical protein
MDEPDPREALTPLQLGALVRLIRGDHPLDVAVELGVSGRRVMRWLKTSRFRAAMAAERKAPMTFGRRMAASLERYDDRASRGRREPV